jgi:zinc protease
MKPLIGLTMMFATSLPQFAQVKLPPYTREVLPNGAVVALIPRTGVPLVHFHVLVKGGSESDPPQMAGLASVTAQLLRRGTTKRSAERFSQDLDFLGGTFTSGFDAGGSSVAITAEFLAKDFDRGLDLLSDALLHPSFPQDEVGKEIARRLDQARTAKDNPGTAIRSYFQTAFFGRLDPRGNLPDELTLARIQRKDILEQYQKLYCGKNMIVSVAGDFDLAAAKAKLAQTFGAAPAGTAFSWAPAPAPQRRSQMLLIDKPDATQTYFVIAQPGIDRRNADRETLELVNTVFGGRFLSMLNEELRVNTGLTYGASSQVEQMRLPGAIAISTYTKTETTARAIDLALEVLKRLNENGLTAEQLESAKAYVKGQYPTRQLETIDQLANVVGEIEMYDLGRMEVDGLFSRIDAVTLAQVNAAARKYYQIDNLTVVLLGAADKIRDSVKKYNSNMAEISIRDPGWGTK